MASKCKIMTDIVSERNRQDLMWGFPQTNTPAQWALILGEEYGEVLKELNGLEFLAQYDAENLYSELVQVAAVCVSIIEHLNLPPVPLH